MTSKSKGIDQEVAAGKPPRPRRLVRVLVPLLALAVSSCAGLVLGEVAVRLAAPQQLILVRPDLWQPADTVGWTLRPLIATTVNTGERRVHVYTDRDGFRVGADGRREAPVRVLLIGDSFAEALQVEHEQTFGHLLERGLADSLGREVVVRNAGVSDWSPSNYLLRAKQLLAREAFDLLLVSVFVGNDAVPQRRDHFAPREPVERHRFRIPRALRWREFVLAFLAPVNDGLEQRSHLFVFLKNQLAGLRMRLAMSADYFPSEFRRSEATSVRWKTTSTIAAEIADVARARGLPTLFVLIPERIQVSETDFARYLDGFGIDSATVDLDQPSRLLGQAFASESLAVVDALPSFRAVTANAARLFGSVDPHLSPDGHIALTAVMLPAALAMVRR